MKKKLTKHEIKAIQLKKAYEGIFAALDGLSNNEAITQLECAKIDIILNDRLIVLDSNSGSAIIEVKITGAGIWSLRGQLMQ